MRGTKFSPLRRYIIAYAKGHNGRFRVQNTSFMGYEPHAVVIVLGRMTNEGLLQRIGRGYYKCLSV